MSSRIKLHKRSINKKEIENLVEYLRDGDRRTIPNDKIFLVLGLTGTGKSTLVQYIAGDNTKLHSVELGEYSGEFIIVDNKRISNSTSISKTVVPEHIYDAKTDTHFYDCPGFSDTRSASIDITATYLIKKLINQSKEIKIAFTVSYPSVRKGVDRNSFMEFVTHAISLMKDFRKYRNSIALVVTKVDNETVRRRGSYQLVPDNTIIRKIGDFLVEVRDEQQQKLDALDGDNQKERSFYEEAIEFINCLATKKNHQYNRIVLFRRPDDSGPVSELESLQEGKKKILELLHQNLKYTKVAPSDFGFTISDKSKNHVYEIIQYLNDEVHRSIRLLIDKMKSAYELQIKINFEKFQMLNDKFNKDFARILKTMEVINDNTGINDFLLILLELLEDLMLQIPESDFQDIIDINSYIIFLRMFNKDNLKTVPYRLKETLTYFENFVDEWKIWTSFLYKVNSFLSDYSVQNNNVLMNNTYKAFNNGNYTGYLETIDTFDKQILNDLSRVKVDELKKSMLTKLTSLRMQTKVEKKCPNLNKIRIQGELIKFSEIDSVPCWNSNVKSIEIFASDTIYIDTDFINSKMKIHNLTIIAPTWNVIGKRLIILDGSSGPSHSTAQAKSSTSSGVDGLDGLPGKPGKAGGAFVGIGMKFINSENLRITSNGGAGGPGQNGGNGADGVNGEKISLPDGSFYGTCPKGKFEVSNGVYEVSVSPNIELYAVFGGVVNTKYNGYGKSGTEGSNAGNGGIGGLGGNAGEIRIIELEKPSDFTTEMNVGAVGSPGIGGRGGSGGWNSRTIVECRNKVATVFFWSKWSEVDHTKYYHQLKSGVSGRIGANTLNMEYPAPGTAISDPSSIINSYKEFVKQKLKNNFNKHHLHKFLQKFESNAYIAKYSKTLEFNLESEANKPSNELRSFYKGLRLKLTTNHLDEEIENLRTRRSIKSEKLHGSDQNVVLPLEINVNSLIPKSNLVIPDLQIHSNNMQLSSYNEQETQSGSGPISYDLNQHTFNSILLLGDLVIRKFTNAKYYYHGKCDAISNNSAQALTLNILNDYERILRENIPNKFLFNYDAIKIQKKIIHLIITNKCADIPKYLTNLTITYYFSTSKDYDAFSRKIYKICDKYLTK